MTEKTTTKTASKSASNSTRDKNSMPNKERDWHGIKVGPNRSSYDLELSKLLVSDKSLHSTECPLFWLLNPIEPASKMTQIQAWHQAVTRNPGLEKKGKPRQRLATEIIQTVDSIDLNSADPGDALLVLGACHAVRSIAGECEFNDWTELVSQLIQISKVADSNAQVTPTVYHWLAIEAPLTIAFQIPEIEDIQQIASQSSQKLAIAVSEMLDTDGWPHSKYMTDFGPLVASWIRSTAIASRIGTDLMLESASQLEWMVPQVLRMLRPDGTLAFSHSQSAPINDSVLDALFKLTHDPVDKPLKKIFRSDGRPPRKPERLPEPSNHSDWAEAAVLQSTWDRKSPKIAVDFAVQGCRVEICRKLNLIQGNVMPSVSIDGASLNSVSGFEVVCQEHEDHVEYLELEMQLERKVKLTRQILLSKNEEFLLVADAVVPEQSSAIEYRCDWPLAKGIMGMHETETREVYLRAKKIQCLVLPLALPEWKVARSGGQLKFQDGLLSLTQASQGCGLYAPMFFDLNPKRSRKKRTWRQLTIGEKLNPVPQDVACAYRVQVDKQQWMFYRKISSGGNRTFLGENFSGEFIFNRFEKNGNVTRLIEIA